MSVSKRLTQHRGALVDLNTVSPGNGKMLICRGDEALETASLRRAPAIAQLRLMKRRAETDSLCGYGV